jgi:hypothetical protein
MAALTEEFVVYCVWVGAIEMFDVFPLGNYHCRATTRPLAGEQSRLSLARDYPPLVPFRIRACLRTC